jgi:hypothetical protein
VSLCLTTRVLLEFVTYPALWKLKPAQFLYPRMQPNITYKVVCTLLIMDICIRFKQALDIMRARNIQALMDSHLEGNYSTEVATTLVNLASQCIQYEPRDRPDIKKLVSILEPLQTKLEVSACLSYLLKSS